MKETRTSKFYRNDVIELAGPTPIDKNDPEAVSTAIRYSEPEGFSEKARKSLSYFNHPGWMETWLTYEYKDKLVVTDEGLYLTEHGDGSEEAPLGGPRFVFDSWEEMEKALEEIYEDLKEDGEIE